MKKNNVLGLVVSILLVTQTVGAQGFGEYGRLLGGLGQKNSNIQKGVAPGVENRGSSDRSPLDSNTFKNDSLPTALIVESNEAPLYARSEDWSDKMMQLPRGAKLVPMVQATAANALWYMVKTQTGAVGWVKSSDVVPALAKRE